MYNKILLNNLKYPEFIVKHLILIKLLKILIKLIILLFKMLYHNN